MTDWAAGQRLAFCSVCWKLVSTHRGGDQQLVAGPHDRPATGHPWFFYRRRQPLQLAACPGVGEPVAKDPGA